MEANQNQMTLSESDITAMAESMPSIQLLAKKLSENKTEIELTKLNNFLSHLASHLQNSKERIDLKYLATDEANQILERTLEIGIHEDQPEKLELLTIFLTQFFNLRFSDDKNKLQILKTFEKTSFIQAEILRNATEWLTLAYGRDIVKQSTDYKPESSEHVYVGYMMEPIMAIFARLTTENTAPYLDALLNMDLLAIANNGKEIKHFDQTGRGFKPTKLGLQLLDYLGVSIIHLPEKNDFKK